MKYYTGIGSRDTTEEENAQMSNIAKVLGSRGYTLRSGGAEGADTAFEEGCGSVSGLAEIFIPWEGFGTKVVNLNSKRYIPTEDKFQEAKDYLIEKDIIPWFERMKQGAQKLHGRNYYQVIGVDKQPSELMVYCADDDKHGVPKGGTRTAILLAKSFNIPTYNIRVPKQLGSLLSFLEK